MSGFREAVIDLDAIRRNVRHLRSVTGTVHTMAVVKANAYGHGAVPVAAAALQGGADWLGVADIEEALELRDAGITAPTLAWLHDPDADFHSAISDDVDLGISSARQLRQAADAALELGLTASVHLKLETGLSRNGLPECDWAEVMRLAAEHESSGLLAVRGIFSHLSNASAADDAESLASFERGLAAAHSAGLTPSIVHLAASAAALRLPAARYSMVRLGLALYGLSPFDDESSAQLGLVPAMTLRGRVAAVRRVEAGTGVSYDHLWRAPVDSTLALVPFGYADGIPRQASGLARVGIGADTHPVVGLIAMDQFVVNVGQAVVSVGDDVVLFGDPSTGVPCASDWALAANTINYDVVTRIGRRISRRHVNA